MIFSFTDSAMAAALGPWLPVLDAVLKSTIVLALTAVLSLLLRRASAATRHFVWTAGLLSALVVPVFAVSLPRWQVPVVTVVREAPAAEVIASAAPPRGIQRRPVSGIETPHASAPAAAPAAAVPSPEHATGVPSWRLLLLAVWAAGVLAILARLVTGVVAIQWVARRSQRITSASWLPLARQLAAELGLRSPVTFHRSPCATMPMACGVLRPTVLMPADADAWPVDRLRIVLLHELAHVKRRDCLTHALAQISCAVHWFNPLAWMAARHLRAERERACDDLVLTAGTHGPDYADQLLEIARVMRGGRFPMFLAGASLAMAHRTQLEGRLIAILDPRVRRSGLTRMRSAAATGVVVCALLPLASMQPWAYAVLPAAAGAVGSESAPASPPGGQRPEAATTARTPQPTPTPATVATAAPAPQPSPAPASTRRDANVQTVVQDVKQSIVQGVVQGTTQGVVQGATQGVVAGVTESVTQAVAATQAAKEGAAKPAKADPRMVAALTAALKDVDAEVREAAMHALIQLRDPAIFEPLVQALRDASGEVRQQAARGLAELRDPRAIEPLTAALKDAEAEVREQVVFALGQMRAQGSAPALVQALKDQSPDVREQAAFALGQIRDARAVDALGEALKDANADVREQAAFALGQIRDRRSVPALTAALADSDADVREQAVFALGQLRDPAAVDPLTKALKDAKADVRQQAAFALGQIRDARSVTPLAAALKDADPEVRQQAAFGLGQLRDRAAVDALVVAIKDDNAEVRSQVVFALGQLRDPRAIDALTAALKDASAEVRQQAAFALGQLAR